MSSDVLVRVEAITDKAEELCDKGHVLRAADYFGRAAEAARALGEDNLVEVHLHLRRGNVLAVFATAPDAASTDPCILQLTAPSPSRCSLAPQLRWSAGERLARCWRVSALLRSRRGESVRSRKSIQTCM